MEFLTWLENSRLGLWVSGSVWGYPIVLTLHAIGMGGLVGIALMFSFRVLGLASGVPVMSMYSYLRIAQAGFLINLLSGVALFCGNATGLWASWPFRIKVILVFVGLTLTSHLASICMDGTGSVTRHHHVIASSAFFAWTGALIAGRLIGYFI